MIHAIRADKSSRLDGLASAVEAASLAANSPHRDAVNAAGRPASLSASSIITSEVAAALRRFCRASLIPTWFFATSIISLVVSVLHGGALFEADYSSGEIYEFSPNGAHSTFASGLAGAEGLAVDGNGNLFVGTIGGSIYKVAPSGTVSLFGSGSSIRGLAFGPQGNLFAADFNTGDIYEFTPSGSQSIFASGLNVPMFLAFDNTGNLFVSTRYSGQIYKITPSGAQSIFASGLGPLAGLAFDSSGNLFVGQNGGPDLILKFTPAGGRSTFTSGVPSPFGLAFDGSGNLFVSANDYSGDIYEVTPSGNLNIFSSVAEQSSGLAYAPSTTGPTISAPQISSGGVVNAASYAIGAPVAPGSIAAVFGTFPISSTSAFTTLPLPTTLSGISLEFSGGVETPLFFVSSGQANIQVPWQVAGQKQVSLSATVNGQTSVAVSVNVASFAPGIFSTNSQGTGQGAIIDSSYKLADSSNPAIAGSTFIQIYCTGLGAVSNQPPSGATAPSSPLSMTTTAPTVTVGGVSAPVQFSGLAPGYVGLYQVNVQMPAGAPAGNSVPVVMSIGGVTSNTVTIAVRQP